MALVTSTLASQLETSWLASEGRSLPSSVAESADAFATAVTNWFSAAQAGPSPCATAMARKTQLMGQAASALAAQSAPGAGSALASAVAAYMTGQSFPPGVASAPIAIPAAAAAFTTVFANLTAPTSTRANQMAAACHVLAVSTIVVMPTPAPPVPVS